MKNSILGFDVSHLHVLQLSTNQFFRVIGKQPSAVRVKWPAQEHCNTVFLSRA